MKVSKVLKRKMDDEILGYEYFRETEFVYEMLRKEFEDEKIYFSLYLDKPSVCLEKKEIRFEFYVSKNSINNEVWLFSNCENKNDHSGGGYGRKLTDLKNQVKKFLEERGCKPKEKEITIFDFIGEN